MSLSRIYTNSDAHVALAYFSQTQNQVSHTLKRLASGLRLVSAADDPSGMAIATGLRAQIGGTEKAIQNAEDGISLLQTADAALSETQKMLFRMRDIAVLAGNSAVITTTTVTTLNNELQSLKQEIGRQASAITFNSLVLFNGAFNRALQIGPDNTAVNQIAVTISAVTLTQLNFTGAGAAADWGAVGSVAISNLTGATVLPGGQQTAASVAQVALGYINSALNIVSNVRANLGAQSERLNFVINDLQAMDVNMTAALSNVQDADMASEIAEFARLQVIQQAGVAMLAQANSSPQQILNLLTSSVNTD